VRSLSWETVLHELLQRKSFPRATVLQEQTAPAWVPHGVTSPASRPAPAWALHGVTASFTHSPAPAWGPFHGLLMDLCSTVDLHGLQGDSLPHHGLLHGLQGNLCSSTWSTSSSSFFTDLGVCRIVSLTSSQSSLPCCSFFPLLKYIILEVLPLSLMGSALASGGSILELSGISSVRLEGSF